MISEKLMNIQAELKAPKGQYNKFGNYNYRSCEDILEAVKPLLVKYKCTMGIGDAIMQIGDRFYVKAEAVITDVEDGTQISNTAFAREPDDKKGMDESQITGTASSYARKYCLNGLFLIDDTKDADSNEHRTESENRAKSSYESKKEEAKKYATPKQIEMLKSIAESQGASFDEEAAKKWTMDYASKVIKAYKGGE